ncbi:MAG: PorV/PorQ family protein [Spirochaetota bacterium]
MSARICSTIRAGVLSIALAAPLLSQIGTTGVSGVRFLRLEPDAVSVGLGEASTSHRSGPVGVWKNPAALADLKLPEMSVSYMRLFSGDLDYTAMSFAYPLPGIGVFGIGLIVLPYMLSPFSISDTNSEFAFADILPDNFSADMSLAVSYARDLGFLTAGVTLKYILQSYSGVSAHGLAGDVSVMARFINNRLGVGFSALNLGFPMKFDTTAFTMPITFSLGADFLVLDDARNEIRLFTDIDKCIDDDIGFQFGAEYVFDKFIAVRLGYQLYTILSIGAGIRLPFGLSVDIAATMPFLAYGNTKMLATVRYSFPAAASNIGDADRGDTADRNGVTNVLSNENAGRTNGASVLAAETNARAPEMTNVRAVMVTNTPAPVLTNVMVPTTEKVRSNIVTNAALIDRIVTNAVTPRLNLERLKRMTVEEIIREAKAAIARRDMPYAREVIKYGLYRWPDNDTLLELFENVLK